MIVLPRDCTDRELAEVMLADARKAHELIASVVDAGALIPEEVVLGCKRLSTALDAAADHFASFTEGTSRLRHELGMYRMTERKNGQSLSEVSPKFRESNSQEEAKWTG